MHGIDLSLIWGTLDRAADGRPVRARQVCLVVPGAGKSAAMVLSGPGAWPEAGEQAERVDALSTACRDLADPATLGRETRLAQALPEPGEVWAVRAFLEAGFTKVGDLAYLKRSLSDPLPAAPEGWPEGVRARQVTRFEADRGAIIRALDRSYVDTLDCPELCGLRETADVLESHRATGAFDPALWWIVELGGEPHGCMLLSRAPEHQSVELVYLGLSPELRGRGVGKRLLDLGLSRLSGETAESVACAVDLRNTPALRLYGRAGFKEFSRRVALVRAIEREDLAAP